MSGDNSCYLVALKVKIVDMATKETGGFKSEK